MRLKGWDGHEDIAIDRLEVILKVREYLNQWRQKGDRIVYQSPSDDDTVIAYIVNSEGEFTDAHVLITDLVW